MAARIIAEYPATLSNYDELRARIWEFIDLIEPQPKTGGNPERECKGMGTGPALTDEQIRQQAIIRSNANIERRCQLNINREIKDIIKAKPCRVDPLTHTTGWRI
ncbi:hypothetical protein FTO70_03825 [Methanosarcina sp. KYL-1]|uniref:hypothetical protein n=1 Tax=Methanosarcina sp. KYL-1 TaxID=2602068 RepID=UPI00210138D9|nr:hypothetical protein [Methanosarcina sp. KYL-1]MCQ1534832.1 hypothetical protein [Methanosarcina sp. KYL-1]